MYKVYFFWTYFCWCINYRYVSNLHTNLDRDTPQVMHVFSMRATSQWWVHTYLRLGFVQSSVSFHITLLTDAWSSPSQLWTLSSGGTAQMKARATSLKISSKYRTTASSWRRSTTRATRSSSATFRPTTAASTSALCPPIRKPHSSIPSTLNVSQTHTVNRQHVCKNTVHTKCKQHKKSSPNVSKKQNHHQIWIKTVNAHSQHQIQRSQTVNANFRSNTKAESTHSQYDAIVMRVKHTVNVKCESNTHSLSDESNVYTVNVTCKWNSHNFHQMWSDVNQNFVNASLSHQKRHKTPHDIRLINKCWLFQLSYVYGRMSYLWKESILQLASGYHFKFSFCRYMSIHIWDIS